MLALTPWRGKTRSGSGGASEISRAGLLEAPAAEQDLVRLARQAGAGDGGVQQAQGFVSAAAVHHAVQVVAPAFGALAAVAQGDAWLRGQALAKGVDLRVVDVLTLTDGRISGIVMVADELANLHRLGAVALTTGDDR